VPDRDVAALRESGRSPQSIVSAGEKPFPGNGDCGGLRSLICLFRLDADFAEAVSIPFLRRLRGSCQLWVRNGHFGTADQCPVFPWKRPLL